MQVFGTIRDILRRKGHDVWSVSPSTLVYDAIAMMADKHVGALLVMNEDKLVGIVSERDYARRVILLGRSSKEAQVRDIMTNPVLSAGPHDAVEACLKLMTEHRFRHLPIVEGETVVGVVSLGDLVAWIVSAQEEFIDQLENYIRGR